MLSPDFQRLQRIRDYCADIAQTLDRFGNSYNSFQSDIAYQKVVAFDVLQIGELAGKLSPEYRRATVNRVQWGLVKALRNIVVHDYGSVDFEQLWEIVKSDIPSLQQFCEEQLAEAGTEDAT